VTGLLEALRPIIEIVLGVLLDLLRRRARPTAEDADLDRDIREKLRARVRKHWLVPALILCLLLAGCSGVRTIYIPYGTPVRLRETVSNVKVWVKDANGKPVPGRMDLPEGWYCLPVPTEDCQLDHTVCRQGCSGRSQSTRQDHTHHQVEDDRQPRAVEVPLARRQHKTSDRSVED